MCRVESEYTDRVALLIFSEILNSDKPVVITQRIICTSMINLLNKKTIKYKCKIRISYQNYRHGKIISIPLHSKGPGFVSGPKQAILKNPLGLFRMFR